MPNKDLIKELDKVFSEYIRSAGICKKCGLYQSKSKLQCVHIFSRKYLSTRWSEVNCFCGCTTCHQDAHANPNKFQEWVKEYLGEEKYDILVLEHNTARKWKDWELEEMIESYERKTREVNQRNTKQGCCNRDVKGHRN